MVKHVKNKQKMIYLFCDYYYYFLKLAMPHPVVTAMLCVNEFMQEDQLNNTPEQLAAKLMPLLTCIHENIGNNDVINWKYVNALRNTFQAHAGDNKMFCGMSKEESAAVTFLKCC